MFVQTAYKIISRALGVIVDTEVADIGAKSLTLKNLYAENDGKLKNFPVGNNIQTVANIDGRIQVNGVGDNISITENITFPDLSGVTKDYSHVVTATDLRLAANDKFLAFEIKTVINPNWDADPANLVVHGIPFNSNMLPEDVKAGIFYYFQPTALVMHLTVDAAKYLSLKTIFVEVLFRANDDMRT